MALWRLRILGEPSLTPLETMASAVRFQYHRTWLLLASLALASRPLSRDDLAERLWPDRDLMAGRHQLRTILRDLLHGDRRRGTPGIGKENIQCSRDSLAIRPNLITTDYAELQALWAESRKLREKGDLPACASCLHDAAVLSRGPFLNLKGLDSVPESWLAQMRTAVDSLEAAVWQQQYDVQQALGDKGDSRSLWEAHLHIFGPQEVPSRATSRLSWEELVSQLESLGQQNLALTVKEERLVLDYLAEILLILPTKVPTAFRRLSIFPQAFTPHQATRIARIETRDLELLAEAHLLRRVGDRYEMPPALRCLVWKRLASAQRQRLLERHKRHFQQFDGDGWPNDISIYHHGDPVAYARWCEQERENYLLALETCLQVPLNEEALLFIDCVQHVAGEKTPLHREVLLRSRFRLEESLSSDTNGQKLRSAGLLANLALSERDFPCAIHYVTLSRSLSTKVGWPYYNLHLLDRLLLATHHAGSHAAFDQAVELAFDILTKPDQIDPRPLARAAFEYSLYRILAENQYARGNLEAALTANHQANAMEPLLREWPPLPHVQCVSLYQRGCILRAMGRRDEALSFFDTALGLFEKYNDLQGTADCLQNMGAIWGEKGMAGSARHHIEAAIAIYTNLEEKGSRAAALGTLGDLLAQMGDTAEAQRLYHEGLDFWRSAKHDRWTQCFERRLTDLDAQ